MRPVLTLSNLLADVTRDARVTLRRMRTAPALPVAIILTIGFGLGLAATIFTVSKAALWDPLPFRQPDELVHLWEGKEGSDERSPTSWPTLRDWRQRAGSFAGLEGYDPANLVVGIGDEARMLRGAQVTPGFFGLLGVPMSAGRDLSAGEDVAAGSGVVVSDRFARSTVPGVALGQTVSVNGTPHVVIGVLPASFQFALLENADIFLPLATGDPQAEDRSDRSLHVVGRLAGGTSLQRARAELSAVASALARDYPEALAGRVTRILPLREALVSARPVLTSLLAAVGLLLVIMGANLALLMLTRYAGRVRELQMRSALGATRARILRQLLVESLLPSVIGAVLATVVARAGTTSLLAAIPDGVRIGMPFLEQVGIGVRIIAVMFGLTIALAAGFGLGPALLLRRLEAGRAGASRATAAGGDRRLRYGLVAAQLSLTVVLLVAAGLLFVSLSKLSHLELGIDDPAGLVVARVPLSGPSYAPDAAQQQFYEALLGRTAALPGVHSAGLIEEVPGGGSRLTRLEPTDRRLPPSAQPRAALRIVGGDYFATTGVPLISGRTFDSRDVAGTQPVAVISASLARSLDEDGRTVGRRLRLAAVDDQEWRVVGVVGDVQTTRLDETSPPTIYLSHLQRAENRMTLVLHTAMEVGPIAQQVRSVVKSLDTSVPVYAVTTLAAQLSDSRAIFRRRLPMILCGVFALAALALTLVAVYSTCLHEVLARRREFGIRLAVGAPRAAIRRLALRDLLRVGAVGVLVGAGAAVVVSQTLKSLLFGIAATDWRVYALVVGGVLAFALLATLGPAQRAAATEPDLVMRSE